MRSDLIRSCNVSAGTDARIRFRHHALKADVLGFARGTSQSDPVGLGWAEPAHG